MTLVGDIFLWLKELKASTFATWWTKNKIFEGGRYFRKIGQT
jgi:hypothetical protein